MPDVSGLPSSVAQTVRGTGEPLDRSVRATMEARFGADFSGVRIFRHGSATRSAADVSANAYTVGNRIVFGQGKYDPHTTAGRFLLAHELAHVAQNQTNPIGAASPGPSLQRDEVSTEVDDIIVWHYINTALDDNDGSSWGAWNSLSLKRDNDPQDPNLAAAEHYMYARFLSEKTPLPSFFVADMVLGYGWLKDAIGEDTPSFSDEPVTPNSDSQMKFGLQGAFEGSWLAELLE